MAIKGLKVALLELDTLASPILGETLMLYLATSELAINVVLVANRGDK